ncbi:unnamed protein product [Acanthoscelides obtectus]|uniref:POU-specific domain-containing protein n=1 Tax=Acanthoscelides obtectus TaxID=200917 RepID=A0A9P0KFG2_ACAOB|nr:unnamed protein product [Acanthoscelides obtectus]CAK1646942.1 POU domain, class 6, transcription factor 1 [Acanthoscelides obtectus]
MAMGSETGTDLSMGLRQQQQTLIKEEISINESSNMMPPSSSASHLNGTMAGLVTLQNLQNLASLQGLPQVASLAAGLSNMANIPGSPVVNAPLNLSLSASAATPRSSQHPPMSGSRASISSPPPVMTPQPQQQQPPPTHLMGGGQQQQQQQPSGPILGGQQPAPMPQLILASGQLVQGIQGAQLLIPTSQGLATQTILTIPVNHVNSNDQMVNLALNNGQVMQTSLANLQAMAQSNLLPPAPAPPPPLTPPTSNGSQINPNLLNPATLTHLLSNGSAQQILQTLPQILNTPPPNPPPLINPMLSTPPQMMPTPTSQPSSQPRQINPTSHYVDTKHVPQAQSHPSPTGNCGNGMMVNRMQSNGDVNVTAAHTGITTCQSIKRSPSAHSPSCNDNSTADLLVDSPNQPTINQTNSNVVDGINLDEIKDFAKAFKLRRLSLGLTQTQVGQALSVTEGLPTVKVPFAVPWLLRCLRLRNFLHSNKQCSRNLTSHQKVPKKSSQY